MSIDITGSGTCPQCKSIYIAKSTSSDVHYFRCIECGYEWIEEWQEKQRDRQLAAQVCCTSDLCWCSEICDDKPQLLVRFNCAIDVGSHGIMYLNVNRYEAVESGSINDVIRHMWKYKKKHVCRWLASREAYYYLRMFLQLLHIYISHFTTLQRFIERVNSTIVERRIIIFHYNSKST